jgi:hypothetical protein
MPSESFHRIPNEREGEMDGNDFGSLVPQERFLFLICFGYLKWFAGHLLSLLFDSCFVQDHEASRRRLAALS